LPSTSHELELLQYNVDFIPSILLSSHYQFQFQITLIMHSLSTTLRALVCASAVVAAPASQYPVPGLSNYYSDYRGKDVPYPGNLTDPILPTTNGTAGPDDVLFQNLLSAEWAIFEFYQQGVEMFNQSSFTALGLPNTTYDRVQEIRDNEAGHLAIFQSQISSNSIKPGPCKYAFGVISAVAFIVTLTLLEIASMAFLTGLVQQANTTATRAALTAIGETESRHNTWALMDIWDTNPFAGPSDTVFPYANEILESTNQFIIPGSCPPDNPEYPYPSQKLPQFTYNAKTNSSLMSGTEIEYVFTSTPPAWNDTQCYYAVFFHELLNISMPFNTKTNTTTIPEFDLNKGLIVGVIADTPGAPTLDTVVAGPVLLVEQPAGAIKLG
jgi:Ferritin-like domain